MKNSTRQLLIISMLSALSLQGKAQDGHYWTEPHGTKSILLSGVVIGTVDDLGTVFYNPARLAKIENPAFLLSGKLYQLDVLKIDDGAGEGLDLNQTRFGGYPNMAAGTFKLGFLKDHFFSYSFLTRNALKSNYFVRAEDVGDIVDAWPGEENYSGQFRFQKELKEDWLGLTWAYNLDSKWSVGISNFIAIRHQNEFLSTELQAYSPLEELAILHNTRSIELTSFGLLWKIALAYELDRLKAGITITTPKINLTGNGSTYYQDFLIGPADGVSEPEKVYVNNYQENLPVHHRSSWAVGFGAGYSYGKSTIHFSAEWFNSVSQYELLASEQFVGQSDQVTYQISMVDKLNPVVNAGIGYEYNFNEKYGFYGSFATDFSAVAPAVRQYITEKVTANASMVQANMYHVGGGVQLNMKWLDVTAGLSHAFANQDIDRPFEFPENQEDFSGEPEGQSEMNIRRWKFVLGFSLPFFKKLKLIQSD